MATEVKRGKKITFERMPSDEEVTAYVKELKAKRPSGRHLTDLVGLLRDGIRSARSNGVEWAAIADFIYEKTGREVPPDAVAQSYTTIERQRQNEGRGENEASYAELRHFANVAAELLASQMQCSKDDAIRTINDEIKKRRDERREKERKKREERREQMQTTYEEQEQYHEQTTETSQYEESQELDYRGMVFTSDDLARLSVELIEKLKRGEKVSRDEVRNTPEDIRVRWTAAIANYKNQVS